jgi:catechol 2,3-dioxygenase-like lactoylglutathione lyase family enzyme
MGFEFNPLIPELSASQFSQSLSFYTDILGFQIEYERPEDQFAFLSYQGNQVMLEQENNNWRTGTLEYPFGRGLNLQMLVDNIDVLVAALKKTRLPTSG